MPKGPEVNPENHGELYEYYAHNPTNDRLIGAIHWLTGKLYSPKFHFADKAEHAIGERIDAGDRFIIASNHLNIADQFPISAALDQLNTLRPLEGHTFALAKAEYFEKPIQRKLLDATGTMLVFRPQDVEHRLRRLAPATRSMVSAAAERITDGWSMLIFPEGTRNRDNPHRLGRIQGSIGRIAASASQEVGVTIQPMAVWYGEEDDHHLLSPTMFFGYPIVGPFESKREVMSLLRPAMQESLEQAIELSQKP